MKMNYWWTSDYHFSHHNIIRYCKRPFMNIEEMNDVIIQRHNERVKPEDTVFFLGDFVFKGGKDMSVEFEKRLNGKFVFIKGNHDNSNSLKTNIIKIYLCYGSKNICMTHRPQHADPTVPLNICGHVHERYKVKRFNADSLIVNVSVDAWNFYPVAFNQIKACVAEFLKKEKLQ